MLFFFFFNDTATTEIYTLSLHDALPISVRVSSDALHEHSAQYCNDPHRLDHPGCDRERPDSFLLPFRSEEHTSELQSQSNLVCRLLLEKKKTNDFLHCYT